MIHAFPASHAPWTTLLVMVCSVLLVTFAASPVLAQSRSPFTFLAIGDAGEPEGVVDANARAMEQVVARLERDRQPADLLVFLGDNFYPIGLNRTPDVRRELIDDVLGPFSDVMRTLGRRNVRAIAGNHDYYCRIINGIPMNTCGTGNRFEDSIDLWTYHYHFPNSLRHAVAEGSADTAEIIFFDSAFLLTRDQSEWRPVLDSLERLLRRSAASPGVKWRIFMAHHSPYSVGDHGGWRRWLACENRVGYIGNCIDEGADPFRYVQQFFSAQDNCTPLYRAYSDSLMSIIDRTGARVQALIAGHDHSLQLLNYPERTCADCPKVFIISGAGSKRQRVKSPNPPQEYTHPINTPEEKGKSVGGFVLCRFVDGALSVQFIEAGTGEVLDMGNGETTFRIDETGALLNAR